MCQVIIMFWTVRAYPSMRKTRKLRARSIGKLNTGPPITLWCKISASLNYERVHTGLSGFVLPKGAHNAAVPMLLDIDRLFSRYDVKFVVNLAVSLCVKLVLKWFWRDVVWEYTVGLKGLQIVWKWTIVPMLSAAHVPKFANVSMIDPIKRDEIPVIVYLVQLAIVLSWWNGDVDFQMVGTCCFSEQSSYFSVTFWKDPGGHSKVSNFCSCSFRPSTSRLWWKAKLFWRCRLFWCLIWRFARDKVF